MRYSNRSLLKNYSKKYITDATSGILHFSSPIFAYPKTKDFMSLQVETEIWATGQRLYKLADKYYGDSTKWWIIARYNERPTEAHFKVGDIIEIPLPLARILEIYGY